MKAKELYEMISNGQKPVIEVTGIIEEGPDKGMRARILKAYKGDDGIYFVSHFDEFKDYNADFEELAWYNNKTGQYNLRWSESGSYPKDGNVDIWFSEDEDIEHLIKLVEVSKLYIRYKESGSEKRYIEWLEEQLN